MREGWINKKLGDVCQVLAGQGAPQGEDSYSDVGTPFVKAGNLVELINGKQESDIQKVSDEVAKEHRLVLYKTGSVVFAKSGMSCMKGHVYTLKNDCYVVSHLAILQPRNISSAYLNYYLQHHKPNNLIKNEGYPSISLKDIENSIISLPSNVEQENRVVSELDKINELVRLKKEQLKDYDNLAQSIFYEMFGDPVVNEKGWELKKLGEEYKVSSSKRIMQDEWTTEGVPFLKVSDVVSKINGQNSEPSTFISETTYSKLVDSNAVPVQNDILITSRGTLGLCYIVKNEDRFYFQDGMITWLAECKGNITPLFLTCLFKNHHFLQQITSKANKSTVAYISISQISKRKIPFPPLALQNLFAQRIELIERQKAEIQSTIADLETLLASRMQYWFD